MSETSDDKPESPPKASPLKELTGEIVGKYRVDKPLGKGAMGMVYLARDTVLDRNVALKVMVAQIADDPELKQRFEREAKHVAKITHVNVLTVYDFGYHTDGSPYIAMEYLKGQDLQKAMRGQPPLEVERKVSIIAAVLAGLNHAHQQGIVHRDIKPANIFINQDGSVKIMDFGVARDTQHSMTGTGNIVGTADYMSPEQVKGNKVDGRSDVFSVGCMLFELLAGKRPFHSDNLMAIFYKITHEEPNFDLIPAGEQYDALLPILKKALSKNLHERYQTAYDFAVALREFLKTHATSATGQHVLEALVEMEAPTSPPQPMTEAPLSTLVPGEEGEVHGATVDLGTGKRGRPGTSPPGARTTTGRAAVTTVLGTGVGPRGQTLAPTKVGGGLAPTVVRPSDRPAPPRPMARPAPAPSGGNPVLYTVLGVLATALVGTGGYIYLKNQQEAQTPPTTLAAATPPPATPTPEAPAVTLAPPPTAAPPPTFTETPQGKAAASLRAAQAAFRESNYDKAIAAAQKALQEDPGNRDATRLVENSLQGQKADSHIRAAQTALGKGDYATASAEAEQARTFAPWDTRATNLLGQVREAQQRAQLEQAQKAQTEQAQKAQQAAAQVTAYLNKATDQLSANNYDAAIALYDEALKLDPTSAAATQGRIGAITAKKVSEAASRGGAVAGGGKGFVPGKTATTSAETRAGAVPDGFEDSAGVTVKKGTAAAELPGTLVFDFRPASPKGGDNYKVTVAMVNQGSQPIALKEMVITTTVNGRRSAGPVPLLASSVAPGQRAPLFENSDFWKEDTTTWSLEVIVRTPRGETYKNSLVWK